MQLDLFGGEETAHISLGSAESFQARSSAQGRLVHQIAWEVLDSAGFELVDERYKLKVLGVEVNLVVRDRPGDRWFCEVTGAYGSQRPGLERTDTVRKIIGSAQLLARWRFTPFLILTTHRPRLGSQAYQMLKACGPEAIFDIIVVSDKADWARLETYAKDGISSGPLAGWWDEAELSTHVRPPYESRSSGLPAIADDRATLVELFENQLEERSTHKFVHSLKFFIPSRDVRGLPINRVVRAQFVQDFLTWCSARNGGLFHQSCEGSWLDGSGNVIDESVLAVETWGESRVRASELDSFVGRMFSDLDQESACYIIDNTMEFQSRSVGAQAPTRLFVEGDSSIV